MSEDGDALRVLAAELLDVADRLDGQAIRLTNGLRLVAAERVRQIVGEGHTPERDALHRAGELAWAAWCYLERGATPPEKRRQDDPAVPPPWPWKRSEWKPKASALRNLVIASALIVSEIDRRILEGEVP